MERHVFKFGGGSWALVIPKAWVEKNGINKNGVVYMGEDERGNLVVSTKGTAEFDAELVISSKIKPETAARWVFLYYRYGVKKLRVYSKEGLRRHFKTIQTTVEKFCPGFEVINISNTELVLQSIVDIKEISADKLLNKLRSLIESELHELSAGRVEGIGKLEELVNRTFMLSIRYINITQGRDSIKYFKVYQLLETVSDQLYELSKLNKVSNSSKLFAALENELDISIKAFYGDMGVLAQAVEIKDSIVSMLKGAGAFEAYLVTEAAKNMVKVAEFALNVKSNETGAFL